MDNFRIRLLKQIAARIPCKWQTELKRLHYRRQIDRGTFLTSEPEFGILNDLITSGDWVVDIGANVGYYTKRFSELVGAKGRVIAFEPVPLTFSLLSGNAQSFPHSNVTLINTAVSDKSEPVGMTIPTSPTGLTNYYEARVSAATESTLVVLSIAIDSLCIDHRVSLVKIDTEGHELRVLAGMRKLIVRDRPVLIIETSSAEIIASLTSLGYVAEKLNGSPNYLFRSVRGGTLVSSG